MLDEVHRRSSFVWADDRASLEAHPDALGVDRDAILEQRVRVAVNATGQILGFAMVSKSEYGDCELADLFVDPPVMRQGVGRALVEDVAAAARRDGCPSMTVVAHPRNFPFYENLGFVVEEPTTTRFGPAFCLRRRL